MVFKFKLVSDEVTNFSREIEIDSSATFLDLRNAILDSVGYSRGEMNSFFLCDDDWERHEEITLEDMGSSSDYDVWVMDETPLEELIEEEGQKLMFVFDYLTERAFYMEMKEEIPTRSLAQPVCTMKCGNPPSQTVDLDEFDAKIDELARRSADTTDLDADFFGDSEYDAEDLPEGFEEEM